MLIAACEKYKDNKIEYPKKLYDLVPNFIDEIPLAKYTILILLFGNIF